MKGIVLMSHGPLAAGMHETSKLFMGDDIPQYTYLCLNAEDSPEGFDEALTAKIKEVDTGEGVILIADLFGGTPCNRAMMQLLNPNVDLIAGMNLAIVLQLLGNRLSDNYDMKELEGVGKDGVVYVNPLMQAAMGGEDDD
ncbi:MAG: PTS sugar transporter subunit IIA [Erysipelotrichaceae bacterium]|nr:PTS sugar transporter subunit IIA [Erysipelotrichaceae bacterium]